MDNEHPIFSGFYTIDGVEYSLYTPASYEEHDSWKYGDEEVPDNLSETDGLSNTRDIMDSISAYERMLSGEIPFAAAFHCRELRDHGFDDWYLPSYEEAEAIRKYRKLDRLPVWTSTSSATHTKVAVPVAHHKHIFVPHYHGMLIMPVRRVKVD